MGTWNNCNASVTPWNTGLSCEEYEPIAVKDGWKENVKDMSVYLGKQANPYDYGWLLELIPDQRGNIATTQVVKHYAMGRLSYEMGRVMPDMKTVYSGDDGTGVILAKFVADEPKDLSAGTLYAAKITQKADESLDIEWIELGRSNNADVFDAIRKVSLN
jgi:secreted PhoX family phosphatase